MIYIYIHIYTEHIYRKKEMKIQERMAREKNYHMKFIFVCMVFMTNMCLNWRNISSYHMNVKNKYALMFIL